MGRGAKTLKNFFFDMEQYFRATNTVTKDLKITLTRMHLQRTSNYGGGLDLWTFKRVDIQLRYVIE